MQYDSSNLERVIYSRGIPGPNDVAEQFHESSKLSRATISDDLSGAARIQRSTELQAMTSRSARSYPHRPAISLPDPAPLHNSFHDVSTRRRSANGFRDGPVTAQSVSDVLHHSYRAVPEDGTRTPKRPSPSAGALYPLDIFLLNLNDGGTIPGESCLYYDPMRHQLAHITDVERPAVHEALGSSDLAQDVGMVVVITAMFARSRIKYGTRGARFCYIEAGHLAQSIVLAAEAAGLSARTYGGFFDDAITALIPGLDGVDSAPVHAVLLGPRD